MTQRTCPSTIVREVGLLRVFLCRELFCSVVLSVSLVYITAIWRHLWHARVIGFVSVEPQILPPNWIVRTATGRNVKGRFWTRPICVVVGNENQNVKKSRFKYKKPMVPLSNDWGHGPSWYNSCRYRLRVIWYNLVPVIIYQLVSNYRYNPNHSRDREKTLSGQYKDFWKI